MIQFAEIPEDGLKVNVNDASWFPDGEVARHGAPEATVSLARSGERVLAVGGIEVDLLLTCDRCLAEFVNPLKVDFRLLLEVVEAEEIGTEIQDVDYVYSHDELEVITLPEPVIDLGDLLYQQVLLAMPRKVLCRSDCRGICGQCGADLNVDTCDCPDSSEGTAFAALGQLLRNKK